MSEPRAADRCTCPASVYGHGHADVCPVGAEALRAQLAAAQLWLALGLILEKLREPRRAILVADEGEPPTPLPRTITPEDMLKCNEGHGGAGVKGETSR